MAHRGQELNVRLLLQTDDPPPIGSSTEQGITKASGSRSRLRRGSRTQGKQTRWNSRNVELDRRVNAHGRIRIEIEKKGRKPVCGNAAKFSKAIKTIVQSTIPLCCEEWKDVSKVIRDHVVDRLLLHFEFDMTKKHVNKYVVRQVQNTFKEYRAYLRRYYCEFENPEEACAHPPERITDPEDWNLLCNKWETLELRKMKEDCDVDELNLFHQSHLCEKDGKIT